MSSQHVTQEEFDEVVNKINDFSNQNDLILFAVVEALAEQKIIPAGKLIDKLQTSKNRVPPENTDIIDDLIGRLEIISRQ